MEGRAAGDGAVSMPKGRHSDHEVTRLIDRLRALVAEQRRLDGGPESERREANRREIARLQRRLATAVKGELRRHERWMSAGASDDNSDALVEE